MAVKAGIDIGSESINAVLLKDKKIIYSPRTLMHFGNPKKTLEVLMADLSKYTNEQLITGFTGSGAKNIAESLGANYTYETTAIPLGANWVNNNVSFIMHIGAKDAYFFELGKVDKTGAIYSKTISTSTKCGGGSGILLTKQARRLFSDKVTNTTDEQERIEKMLKLGEEAAFRSMKELNIGGRCGVVIQSDMIHRQNRGELLEDIIRGLYDRITLNYMSDVVGLNKVDPEKIVLASGGVFLNKYIVEFVKKTSGLNIQIDDKVQKIGAIGATVTLKDTIKRDKTISISPVAIKQEQVNYAPPLSQAINLIKDEEITPLRKFKDLIIYEEPELKQKVVLGVDGGSTTTKAAIVKANESLKTLAEICIETHGKPVNAAQEMFRQIEEDMGKKLDILGVGYTGSSGSLYYKLFTDHKSKNITDAFIDEITCHALGVKQFHKGIDTIFELGGQDAKFTRFDGEVVRSSKMNLSCMAGTGQTMQNMIAMLGIDFQEFDRLALSAKRTPVTDDSCGVFTEAGISKLIGLGLPKDEVAAAIAYACIGGYVNKFIGNENIGENISAQGGPFRSKACLAALALQTGLRINALPHRQLFGAYGAAIAAYNKIKNGQ